MALNGIVSMGKPAAVLLITLLLAVTVIWFVVPQPELLISIFIRLSACAFATYLVVKLREWRIIFLAVMFFLMAVRQLLTLLIWMGLVKIDETSRVLSEFPGFLVTLLSLISIVYIGLLLSGKIKIITYQKADINALKKLLPICSSCKKIRNDDGYWNQVESYFKEHADIEFSHGICPNCLQEIYGQEEWFLNGKIDEKVNTGKEGRLV